MKKEMDPNTGLYIDLTDDATTESDELTRDDVRDRGIVDHDIITSRLGPVGRGQGEAWERDVEAVMRGRTHDQQ